MRKRFSLFIGIVIAGLFFMAASVQAVHAQESMVSYQTFYDELAPYGQWVNDGQYGNVWVPNVEPGFRPYASDGHWAMTDNGNMWVSEQPWGWAAYHYGRWTYNGYYGWVWIPGYEWAPAWVSWRSGGGYYGWAPMGPGYMPGDTYNYPDNYWVFVNPEYLYHPHVFSYYEPRNTVVFINHTSYINETYGGGHGYYYGPRREVIERETHHPVEVYRVGQASSPGEMRAHGNEISVYHPAVNRESVHSARPANVMSSERPVGRPENYSAEHRQPEFRESVQRQNAAAPARGQQEQHGQQPMHSEPVRGQQNEPVRGQQQGEPMRGQQHNEPVRGQQQNEPVRGQQQSEPMRGQQHNEPVRGQQNEPVRGQQHTEPVRNQQQSEPVRNQQQNQNQQQPQQRQQQQPQQRQQQQPQQRQQQQPQQKQQAQPQQHDNKKK